VVVVLLLLLPDPIRGIGVQRNSADTQQSGHTPKFGPEIKDGRKSAKASSSQRGVAVPALSTERWAEMARQILRRVRPVGRPPNRLESLGFK